MHTHNSTQDDELVSSYIRACSTEYEFDCRAYDMMREDIKEFNGIPRPAKWMSKTKKTIARIKAASHLLRLFWSYIGFYFFTLMHFLFLYPKCPAKYSKKLAASHTLALATCQRAVNSIKQACNGYNNDRITWLSVMKEKKEQSFSHAEHNIISYTACTHKAGLLHALLLSMRAHKKIRLNSNKNLIMQTYTALSWFHARLAVENLHPESIIIASHYDRWSILADDYAIKRRIHLKLVQHGIVVPDSFDVIPSVSSVLTSADLPYKLKALTEICAYNHEQANIILEGLVNKYHIKDNIKIKYFSTAMTLTKIDNSSKKRILFIGHPACEELQCLIYSAIRNSFDFHFYYKPHPNARKMSRIHALDWKIIEDKNLYPFVDFLISYDSTLVIEYRSLGIDASFIHPMWLDSKEFKKGIDTLITRLSELEPTSHTPSNIY